MTNFFLALFKSMLFRAAVLSCIVSVGFAVWAHSVNPYEFGGLGQGIASAFFGIIALALFVISLVANLFRK